MSGRRARRPSLGSVVGWGVVAVILAVGRPFDDRDARTDLEPETPAIPGSVGPALAAEPEHAPVRIVAERPTRPRLRVTAKRPFATARAFASPLIMPRLSLPRALTPRLAAVSGLLRGAPAGEPVSVTLTAYCLRGRTRRGREVRPGIIAADPRVFPLARHVELFSGGRYLGKFLVDDTGGHIRGARIDIWTPDCADARAFGRRSGVATLVAR